MRKRPILVFAMSLFAAFVPAQDNYTAIVAVHPNQRLVERDLHLRIAQSPEPAATLAAAVETALDNPEVCCAKNSSLSQVADMPGRPSLQDIGTKLAGRHVLGDSRPVLISSQFIAGTAIRSCDLVGLIRNNQRLLVQWNSRVFVLSGVVFDDKIYSDGNHDYVLRKLLLLDPAQASPSHEAAFDREKDDWSKIDGFLVLKTSPE